ncbi:PAS domain S-box protein [Rufibacter roseus]|uniref:histidine kinase n=1 Tax=Rufibacter roseus TaxID=1567108 RepID=A0ABW2DKM5_9BACT|nr:PAS domain S-box protein [Rufibacter roseus]
MGANNENSPTQQRSEEQWRQHSTEGHLPSVGTPATTFSSSADNAVSTPDQELEQARQALQSMRQELATVRQELEEARRQINLFSVGGSAFASTEELTEFRRVQELERLGKEVLEKTTTPGSTLEEIISFYLAGIEKIHEGMICSCMRLEGSQLFMIAAPSLPAPFASAVNGATIGRAAGSCGTAAYFGEKVIATDIAQDERWQHVKELALSCGLKASWAFPIMRANKSVLGTLSVYYNQPKAPTPEEEASLESVSSLLQLILENKLADQALRESNERFNLAAAATNDAIYDWAIPSDEMRWGEGFERMFGLGRTKENSSLEAWKKRLHPEDREKVVASLAATLEDPDKDHWGMEYRIIKADGNCKHVSERGFIVRNENRKAIRMVGALQDVTEQKLAEEELRKLSVIAKETINGVIILEPDFKVQWVNHSFTKITGYTLDEVQGSPPGQFLNGEETDRAVMQYIRQQLERKHPFECELLQYAKSGRKCWIRLQVQPLFDDQGQVKNFFALLTDITQEKKEEQQLKLLESVIKNAHEAIAVSKVFPKSKLRPRTIFCNKAYLDLTGYLAEEVIAKQPLLLSGPETDMAALQVLEQAIQDTRAHETELLGYKKSGEKFWAHVSLIPIFNKQNQITHWLTMMRDISARKVYERERELLISELSQNNADLKQYSFIASHNLRAPLSNLKGIVNLIDMDKMPDGQNKLLIEKFKESTLQLSTVIDDLLDVLVIRNGVEVKKERVHLQDAFEKVKASVEELLKETGATLETDFSAVPEVEYNPGYMHSILLNLLTNAIKYRSPDRKLQIVVKAVDLQGRPALQFSDNGLGVDLSRFRERIFGLYQRFHKHKDSKGMGLYIAQSQAKAMGGLLLVDSEVNVGTTFTLLF